MELYPNELCVIFEDFQYIALHLSSSQFMSWSFYLILTCKQKEESIKVGVVSQHKWRDIYIADFQKLNKDQ